MFRFLFLLLDGRAARESRQGCACDQSGMGMGLRLLRAWRQCGLNGVCALLRVRLLRLLVLGQFLRCQARLSRTQTSRAAGLALIQ